MVTNVFFSLLSFASSIILAFFLSPYILRQLGDARYGIWALFGELLSYYGLLDFGVRGALNYYVGKSLANQRAEDVRRYVSSAFAGLTAISAAAFAASAGLVFLLRHVLIKGTVDPIEVLGSALLFLLIFCVGMPLELFAAVLVGSRRQFLVSASEIVSRLVATLLMFLGLRWWPGLLVLVAAQLTGKIIYWISIVRNTRRHVPEAVISLGAVNWRALRQLGGYGGQNAFINVSWLLVNRKDVTLITAFLGARWVPHYSFARLLIQSISDACSSITQALRPNLIHHWARGEYPQAYAIYYTAARYSSFLVTMCAAFLLGFAKEFFSLWIGSRFVTGPVLFRTDLVLYLLLAAQIPRMGHSISWQLLFATYKQKALSVLVACEGVVNLTLALCLVRGYGVVGIALATTIPMLISHGIVLPLLMRRLVGISLRRYLLEGVGRPLAAASVVWAFGLILKRALPPLGWRPLLLDAAILGTLGLTLGMLFVIRPEDRARVAAWAGSAWRRLRRTVPVAPSA
jgi:O-antigen/teichoic acid export membrane protein